jgi:fatty-acyl-CoA synthase
MSAEPSIIDWDALIHGSRIRGQLYRDPAVFEAEFEAIWHKVWVYVGHESEVPRHGDYVRRQIGRQPVIMLRGDDDRVRVFFNRCRHRGNLVCHRDRGNGRELRCPYHGWTYSNTGQLLAPTFEEGYDDSLRREDFGLTAVPRLGTYRGLVFASLSDSGISLDEHLGQVREYIDLFMDVSPTGEAELCTGIQKLRYNGNWKFLPENSLEGDYHGPFLHRIAFELHGKRTGLDLSSLYQNEVPDVIRSLPAGTWSRTTAARRWPRPRASRRPRDSRTST